MSKPSDERMPWWKTAVFYQIYPRSFLDTPFKDWADGGKLYRETYPIDSFLDTDGDGVGDLQGIRQRVPYLAELGIDAVWLSPFFASPMADFGYDVADYRDVDPLFGTLADFDALVADAKAHGIRTVIDFVPNHTSDRHPWFVDARSSRTAAHRDWYVWRDGVDGAPPNEWRAMFADEPAWTFDDTTSQWYLRLFLKEQPDLEWKNPAVVEAMHDVLRFWLDRGVDGFRIDVAHLLGKEIDDSDFPTPSPYTHEVMRGLRRVVDAYPGDRMLVGEVYIMSTKAVAEFYGDNDELHLSFNFPPLYAPFEADAWRKRVNRVMEELDPKQAWPTWVLSNHDNSRHRSRYGDADKARAACLLLLGLRGSPFLYAGEELGLGDATIPTDRAVDPAGRDGCRAPIPWDDSPTHGWATADPWLPWPPDTGDRESFLALYRQALHIRRSSPALREGTFEWLPSADGVLAWERRSGNDRRAVIVNMTAQPVALDAGWEIEVSSAPSHGQVPAWGAVWLAPAASTPAASTPAASTRAASTRAASTRSSR